MLRLLPKHACHQNRCPECVAARAGEASCSYTTEVISSEHADKMPRIEGTLHFAPCCAQQAIEFEVPVLDSRQHKQGLLLHAVLTEGRGAAVLKRRRLCRVTVPPTQVRCAAQFCEASLEI